MKLIAVSANGPRAGKSSTCGFLATHLLQQGEFNSHLLSMAKPIKDMAIEHFGWDGEKDEKGRQLLFNLGTFAGRAYNKDIWVNKWRERVLDTLSRFPNTYVLCDDLRFENEYRAVQQMGGIIIRVEREGFEQPGMAGETFIPPEDIIDYTISNDGTQSELNTKVSAIVEDILSE